jgi:hypothetical protein
MEHYLDGCKVEADSACYWAGELAILLVRQDVPQETLDYVKEQLDLAYQSIKRHRSH